MAGSRVCDCCGAEFTPNQRSRARFCSTKCRVAAAKARKQGVPERRPELRVMRGEVVDDQAVVDVPADADSPLMTMEELARLLAHRLASPNTPPTAVAGLAREFRSTVLEAEKRRPAEQDPLERLRLVVSEKTAGA